MSYVHFILLLLLAGIAFGVYDSMQGVNRLSESTDVTNERRSRKISICIDKKEKNGTELSFMFNVKFLDTHKGMAGNDAAMVEIALNRVISGLIFEDKHLSTNSSAISTKAQTLLESHFHFKPELPPIKIISLNHSVATNQNCPQEK